MSFSGVLSVNGRSDIITRFGELHVPGALDPGCSTCSFSLASLERLTAVQLAPTVVAHVLQVPRVPTWTIRFFLVSREKPGSVAASVHVCGYICTFATVNVNVHVNTHEHEL